MDPLNDLLVAEHRRTEFERRAAAHRLARSMRRRPRRPAGTMHRASTAAPLACCPAVTG